MDGLTRVSPRLIRPLCLESGVPTSSCPAPLLWNPREASLENRELESYSGHLGMPRTRALPAWSMKRLRNEHLVCITFEVFQFV